MYKSFKDMMLLTEKESGIIKLLRYNHKNRSKLENSKTLSRITDVSGIKGGQTKSQVIKGYRDAHPSPTLKDIFWGKSKLPKELDPKFEKLKKIVDYDISKEKPPYMDKKTIDKLYPRTETSIGRTYNNYIASKNDIIHAKNYRYIRNSPLGKRSHKNITPYKDSMKHVPTHIEYLNHRNRVDDAKKIINSKTKRNISMTFDGTKSSFFKKSVSKPIRQSSKKIINTNTPINWNYIAVGAVAAVLAGGLYYYLKVYRKKHNKSLSKEKIKEIKFAAKNINKAPSKIRQQVLKKKNKLKNFNPSLVKESILYEILLETDEIINNNNNLID